MSNEETQVHSTAYAQYQAYLLRLWQETPQSPWRASLQFVATGERRNFADVESLLAFLRSQIESTPGRKEAEP